MHKYFKDENNKVYAYEADGSQDAYIKPGLMPITEAEMLVLTAPVVAVTVPSSCTRRQGQLALLEVEKLDDAEALIAAIPDAKQRRAAQIEYEADTWERSNAFVQAMWAQLGGTLEQLDDLFRMAVTL